MIGTQTAKAGIKKGISEKLKDKFRLYQRG